MNRTEQRVRTGAKDTLAIICDKDDGSSRAFHSSAGFSAIVRKLEAGLSVRATQLAFAISFQQPVVRIIL